jgi:hypothetical protein
MMKYQHWRVSFDTLELSGDKFNTLQIFYVIINAFYVLLINLFSIPYNASDIKIFLYL